MLAFVTQGKPSNLNPTNLKYWEIQTVLRKLEALKTYAKKMISNNKDSLERRLNKSIQIKTKQWKQGVEGAALNDEWIGILFYKLYSISIFWGTLNNSNLAAQAIFHQSRSVTSLAASLTSAPLSFQYFSS